MNPKPLAHAAAIVVVAATLLASPAESLVQRTVLVEETGWAS